MDGVTMTGTPRPTALRTARGAKMVMIAAGAVVLLFVAIPASLLAEAPSGPPVPSSAPTATNEAPLAGESYSYEPQSRRDPFRSLVRLFKVDKAKAELPPLQRVELTDVKLMGIAWGKSGYYGLIQTPDGKGYTVREGTLLGTNNGRITLISEKRLVVTEPAIDVSGQRTTREIEILQRPKEAIE